jgi:hypothetical protein
MTDGLGFDVALPPGTWCFAWRPPGKPGPADPLVDPCAYVARIESSTKDLGAALMLPQLPTTPCPLGIP